MKFAAFDETVFSNEGKYKMVYDWYTASVITGIDPHKFSYLRNSVGDHQRRISLNKGKRVVYKSSPTLNKMQTRLLGTSLELFYNIPEEDREHIIAYVPNLNPAKFLGAYAGAECMISFDIRKFYDNITFNTISKTFEECGFQPAGAKLLSRYCVVNRKSLQQGSPCSPMISNLVGYHMFDKQIKAWVAEKYPDLDLRYVRYCDNIVLFSFSDLPENFYAEYKAKCVNTMWDAGFRTHKWMKVTNTNPRRNMSWLGVVLNKTARVDKYKYDVVRGELFSLIKCVSVVNTLGLYAHSDVPRYPPIDSQVKHLIAKKQLSVLRGKISYINSVCAKQGLALTKLYEIVKLRLEMQNNIYLPYDDEHFAIIKTYKDNDEPVESYVERVKASNALG